MNTVRLVGLFVFAIGCYCLILHAVFRVRSYQLGMSLFVIGTAMTLLPLII